MARRAIRIETAGWAIWSRYTYAFPNAGAHLRRYALRLTSAEINSPFDHPHQQKTYER